MQKRLIVLAATAFAATLPTHPLTAQEPAVILEGRYEHFETRLEVQLSDREDIRLENGQLVTTAGESLGRLSELFAEARAEPLFGISYDTCDRWHREALSNLGAGDEKPDHLGRWYRLTTPDAASATRLLAELRKQRDVSTAYYEPKPELPAIPQGGKKKNNDIAPTTPLFTGRQGYLGKPPAGINTPVARVILGGRGQGVQVTDMETGWYLNHEDICQLTTKAFLGRIDAAGNHGTAVVGEYASDRNRYGTTGISDQVVVKVSTWDDGGVGAAITRGVNASKKGDIVLLEVHYRTSLGFVPAEYYTSNYNIIKNATSRGINIVEAGGNGNNDLDNQSRFGRRFDLTFRDSGAIMVGASNGSALARAGFSNHGSRITCNGWGYNVTTTGYGNLFNPGGDRRQHYTRSFSGTSSASPIVTGAVASLVGAVKFQNEKVLTVNEVRQLLRKHGTPCSGKIQNRPDLAAMLRAVGLPDGFTARSEIVRRGSTLDLDVDDKKGRIVLIWLSDTIKKIDLGLNRKLHLDLARSILLPAVVLTSDKTTLRVPVPNTASLLDECIYAQAVTLDAALKSIKVTSSSEVWIQ